MANKEVLDQLEAEKITRTNDLESLGHAHDTLATLVASWQREAGLLSRSQRKGWQSEAKTLQLATALVKLEILALDKRVAATPPRELDAPAWVVSSTDGRSLTPGLPEDLERLFPVDPPSFPAAPPRQPVTGPTPSWTHPAALDELVRDSEAQGLGRLVAGESPCPTLTIHNTAHEPHTWVGAMNKRWQCNGVPASFFPSPPPDLDEPVPATSRITHANIGEIEAFLSGAVDELPSGLQPSTTMTDCEAEEFMQRFTETSGNSVFVLPSNDSVAVMERLGTDRFREARVHEEIDQQMPDVHADPIIPPFREASPPDQVTFMRPIPPAGAGRVPYTWAELAAPADPRTIPEHMSPSQLSTLDDCPARARISRYEGEPGIPLWGGVGGTAFHAAVAELELKVWGDSDPFPLDLDELNALWQQHFQLTIMKEINWSGVPMADWHASNRGKENYSWWGVEGGDMLRRYMTYRIQHDDGRRVLTMPDGRRAVELELNLPLEDRDNALSDRGNALPVKVILDIVWVLPDGSLEIWDHKTKGWPVGPDTIQLGTQQHALSRTLDGEPVYIQAGYFDARKGEVVDLHDSVERHPVEELEIRYADADDKRRFRPAIPVRSNLCKACPIAYLCPVGSKL